MKQIFKSQKWLSSAAVGLALAGATVTTHAQTSWANPKAFDSAIGSWVTWNGWGLQSDSSAPWLTFDPYLDAQDNPGSGSMRYDVPYVGASGEQIMTFGTFSDRWGWDGGVIINCVGAYKNVSLDLKVDPNTAPTVNGDYGPLEIGLTTDGWGQVYLTNYTLPLSVTSWTHLVVPIDQAKAGVEKANGFFIKMWSNGTFTNTFSFNIDNIWLEPMTNEPPPPPPTLTLQKAVPGLNLIAAGSGQYDRQNIRTINPDYSWVGKGSTPVTYSFTVASFPGTNNPGFEVHSYLIPVPYDPAVGPGTIGNGSAADWDQTNCVFMDLQNRADGSAGWTFRWKTNAIPDGNGTYYSDPLAILDDANGPVGTWTLRFLNDTQVTMTSPSGQSTNFEFSSDKLAGYVDSGGAALPLYYYVGAKPQQNANLGVSAVISHVKVQGVASPIDHNFLNESALDTSLWEVAANNAGGVQLVPANAVSWVHWTLPDVGFALQTNSAATPTGWKEIGLPPIQLATGKQVLITASELPGAKAGFYRMIKRPFMKLQVLMPGETAAPDTASGKTGTPDAQTAGVPFDIIVNAVDNSWHHITLAPNDEIAITSDDAGALLPANATLVGGTHTFNVTFGSSGSFTITATDVTDSNKTANTATATTVNP